MLDSTALIDALKIWEFYAILLFFFDFVSFVCVYITCEAQDGLFVVSCELDILWPLFIHEESVVISFIAVYLREKYCDKFHFRLFMRKVLW